MHLPYQEVIAIWLTLGLAIALPGPLRSGQQHPIQQAVLNRISQQGCFSSVSNTTNLLEHTIENSWDYCSRRCKDEKHKPVALVYGSKCYCADTYPPMDTLVADDRCDDPCPGFSFYAYGSTHKREHYTVTNTGLDLVPEYGQHGAILLHSLDEQPEWFQRYLGCYAGMPDDVEKHYRISWNDASRCHQLCKEGGKRYLMLSHKRCFCTNFQPSDDMRLSDGNCTESCGGSQQGLCGGFSYHIRQRTYSIYDTIPAVNDQKDESKASPINTNTENGIASASLLKALQISVWSLLSYSSAHGKGNTTNQAAIHEPVANFYRLADTINASLQYLASLAFKSTSQEDDDPVQELEL